MFLLISLAAAIVGVGLAAVAAFQRDTGIDGTIGGYLALLGAVGVTVSLIVVWSGAFPAWARGFFAIVAGLVAILSGVAAWFLMQDALLAAMVTSLLALIVSGIFGQRKKVY